MKSLQLADGRRLAWREAGSGAPLVLLHGWAMSSVVFTEIMSLLSATRRVLAPDLPGHGDSDAAAEWDFAAVAADLEQWLSRLGLDQTAVLGWSLGGQVALELSVRWPALVGQLLLVATTPCFENRQDWAFGLPPGQVKAMSRNLKRDYRRTMEDFFHLQFAGEDLSRERLRDVVQFAVRAGRLPKPEVALAALAALAREDQRTLLDQVMCPCLLVHGELDMIVSAQAGVYLAQRLRHSRLELLPGVGHAPFLSRPAAVAEICREYLP